MTQKKVRPHERNTNRQRRNHKYNYSDRLRAWLSSGVPTAVYRPFTTAAPTRGYFVVWSLAVHRVAPVISKRAGRLPPPPPGSHSLTVPSQEEEAKTPLETMFQSTPDTSNGTKGKIGCFGISQT